MKYCAKCGRQFVDQAAQCPRCKLPLYFAASPSMQQNPQRSMTPMEQQNYLLQQQLQVQQQQLMLQQQQMASQAKCPRCGSTSLSAHKKGFGIGKAVVGAAIAGPFGLMAGNMGAKKVRITCLKCGKQFWS